MKFKNHPSVASINKMNIPKNYADKDIFPQDPEYPWNIVHFGPVYIPKKGETIILNQRNLPIYKRVISEYEGNIIYSKGRDIILNGNIIDKYTLNKLLLDDG